MPFMVSTTCCTTWPPCSATADGADRQLAGLPGVVRVLLRRWSLSSSIEAAVSSSALACCSVRVDRSALPAADFAARDLDAVGRLADLADQALQVGVHVAQRIHQAGDLVAAVA